VNDRQDLLKAIATRHGGRLRRFVESRLRRSPDVPDLVQEVFLRLLRVTDPETIRSPEAYLFTIAKHVLHQHRVRKAAARDAEVADIMDVLEELENIPEPGIDAEVRLEAQQRLEELERALPLRVYATLVLNRIGGWTLQEVADELGISHVTAKKYLAKALTYCRQRT
jgi:RNA polymerase sigma factor (sigma-70 family)